MMIHVSLSFTDQLMAEISKRLCDMGFRQEVVREAIINTNKDIGK